MKWLPIATALVASAAAIMYAILWIPEASAAAGIAAAGMFYAIWSHSNTARTSAEFLVICELIVLGTLWPSIWTVLAVFVLGAGLLAIRALLTRRLSRWSALYVSASALLAATSLLGQALWLVRAARKF